MGKRVYDKIRKVRDSFGLSQDEFGGKIGVTRQTVSKWELGTTLPSYDNLKKIHIVYGAPLSYLFDGYSADELRRAIEEEKIKDAVICPNQREIAVANGGVLASSCGVANNSGDYEDADSCLPAEGNSAYNSADGLNANDFVKPKKESKLLGNVLLITAILVLAVLLVIFVVAFMSLISPFARDNMHLISHIQVNNLVIILLIFGTILILALLFGLLLTLIKRNKIEKKEKHDKN